jgi:hypothetical protein
MRPQLSGGLFTLARPLRLPARSDEVVQRCFALFASRGEGRGERSERSSADTTPRPLERYDVDPLRARWHCADSVFVLTGYSQERR